MGVCAKLTQWVQERLFLPSDAPLQRMRKWVLFLFFAAVLALSICFITVNISSRFNDKLLERGYTLFILASLLVFSASVLSFLLVSRRAPQVLLVASAWSLVFWCFSLDLLAIYLGVTRTWPLIVVIIDLLLVLRVRDSVTFPIVGASCIWIIVTHFDLVWRWGIQDIPEHFGQRGTKASDVLCCPNPPCKSLIGREGGAILFSIFVLVGDFLCTRAFSHAVLKQKDYLQSSVDTAQRITELLAKFDLDEAELALCRVDEDSSPEEMHAVLRQLLQNLRSYRPYLPAGLFREAHTEAEGPTVQVIPGTTNGRACIVFTDVVASTRLWNHDSEAMTHALRLHNRIVRRAVAAHQGYEVKTIGETFMVAFETCVQALNFGIEVQRNMLEEVWPESLVSMLRGRSLSVRIGMQEGPLNVDVNPVTMRADYVGTTVNMAAALERASAPHEVALPWSLAESMSQSDFEGLTVERKNDVRLKGFADTQAVASVIATDVREKMRVQPSTTGESGSKTSSKQESGVGFYGAAAVRTPSMSSRRSSERSVELLSEPESEVAVRIPSLELPPMYPKPDQGTPASAPLRCVTSATVASVEIADPQEWTIESNAEWQDRVAHVVSCAGRCHGSIVSITGRSILVTWNVVSTCHAHTESFVLFALLSATGAKNGFATGCCTGKVCHGSVGTARQRFVNVGGECVDVSRRLGELARVWSHACLYGVLEAEPPGKMQELLSAFPQWEEEPWMFGKHSAYIVNLTSGTALPETEDG
eukprot:Rhum_TRINITY_DN13516_c0_g1::Rhum_TRINITY_DN13516_c0_g1_i1::g.60904::m.60904